MNMPHPRDAVLVDHASGRDQSATVFTFICGDCGRECHSLTRALPKGWDLLERDCSGQAFARCQDCAEKIGQDYIEGCAPDAQAAAIDPFAAAIGPVDVMPAPVQAFPHLFLERQSDGRYEVVMTPEGLQIRLHPSMWYFSPASARKTAMELLRLAHLAEHPGQMPTRKAA